MTDQNLSNGRTLHQKIGLALGPVLAIAMLSSAAPDGLSDAGWTTAAIGVLMAVWWATEAVPIAITAMLPLVVFPLLGVATIQDTASPYANKVIYLFLGGFIVAFAMQRWNLHRRIALNVLQVVGGNGRSLVGGFMLASAVISMWVMNTSTTMMLLPIAVSIIGVIHKSVGSLTESDREDFQYSLLLGVAYGATIGGMATLVGTAPNAMLAAFMQETYGTQIDFASWMLVGLPLSAIMLPLAWVLRPMLVKLPGLAALDDSGIAMAGAIALFLIPSGDKRDPLLLRWHYTQQLPWSVLILFGGGLTLAAAVARTGLAEWLGNNLQTVGMLPVAVVVIIAATMIIFLTELTSNIATTATFLPVVGAIAIEAGFDPIVLTVPVTFAASCAFMLPVATPPNAIVFGSGLLAIPKMARAGFALNIIGIFVVSLAALYLAPRFLN